MRGEKLLYLIPTDSALGSPPHARGKAQLEKKPYRKPGITPACAGKRNDGLSLGLQGWDHPRMRGEKRAITHIHHREQGSPPHARGKVSMRVRVIRGKRITPACAGKRTAKAKYVRGSEDHPRMRGEKPKDSLCSAPTGGSPPHARGKAQSAGCTRCTAGITPACAGKS